MENILNRYAIEDYLVELPAYLKDVVEVLTNKGFSFEQIANNLSMNPSQGLVAKGSERWDSEIFMKILNELKKNISDENSDLAKSLKNEANLTVHVIIILVSNYVNSHFGISASLCVPFVILAIITILKSSINTLDNNNNDSGNNDL